MSTNSWGTLPESTQPGVELLGSLWGKLQAWHDQRMWEEQDRTQQRQEALDEVPAPTKTPRPRKPRVPRPLGLKIEPFKPFPLECLPDPVREYVVRASSSMGSDESLMALPVLAALASVIGNFRRILLDDSWSEPSALQTAVVSTGYPSPDRIIDTATTPLQEWQRTEYDLYDKRCDDYKKELAEYRAAARRIRKKGGIPLPKPVAPTYNGDILDEIYRRFPGPESWKQPRGLLVSRTDLYFWLRGRDPRTRETARQGVWSDQHGDPPLRQESRSDTARLHQAPYGTVSLAGIINPRNLAEAFTKRGYVRGRVARLLFAYPPSWPREINWDDYDSKVIDRYDSLIHCLKGLTVGQGTPRDREPKLVDLTSPARDRFVRFVKEIAEKRSLVDATLWPSIENLECYAARLALILHLTRKACGEPVNPEICDDTSMERGIILANWFGDEATRFHTTFCLAPRNERQRHVIQWLFQRGGQGSIRQALKTLVTEFKKPEQARAAFNELVNAGLGWWNDTAANSSDDLDRVFVLGEKRMDER